MAELWSDGPFSRREVEAVVREHLPEDADVLTKSLLPGIVFPDEPRSDGRVALQLGGDAPLPAAMEWPRNEDRDLYLIGGVDLGAVHAEDPTGALPRAGMLLFFYDILSWVWGPDPNKRSAWRVMLLDAVQAATSPRRQRRPHPSERGYALPPFIELSTRANAVETWTLPSRHETCVRGTFYAGARWEEMRPRYQDFDMLDGLGHRSFLMFGWPWCEQPYSRHIEMAQMSSGRSSDELTDADVAEWHMLMQFDRWDERGGTLWGDTAHGMLQFWIHDADLRAQRFDRVWIHVDSA